MPCLPVDQCVQFGARRRPRSNGCGALRAASAASARSSACPPVRASGRRPHASPRGCRCNAGPCRSPPRKTARVRSAIVPDSAFIDTSSLISKPWNPIVPRITRATIVAEVVAGWAGSIALNTTCAVMRQRQIRQRPECREVGPFQLVPRRIDRRQTEMGVGGGAAMAGNVLEHRQHAALLQPFGDRAARSPRPCRARCHKRGSR